MRRIVLAACIALLPTVGMAQTVTRSIIVNSQQTAGTTSATPGTFTVAAPQTLGYRNGCSIVNTGTGVLSVYLRPTNASTAPTLAASVPIAAGGKFDCAASENDEIDVASSVASNPYVLTLR